MDWLATQEQEEGPRVHAAGLALGRPRAARREEFTPPLDVREWVDPWRLATWSEREAKRLLQNLSRSANSAQLHNDRPGIMLRLLAFAYASRVFDSEGIVHKCCFDPVFRELCDGQPPSPRELWSFRRHHRGLLEEVLLRLLLRSVQERFGLEALNPQPGLEDDLRHRAVERLNTARHMDQP